MDESKGNPSSPLWVPRAGETCRRSFTGVAIRRNRTKGAGEDNRTTVTINTDEEDRHGTIIEPEGARLENYNRNPIVLINHRYSLLAGTSAVSLRNGRLVANMSDDDWDMDDPDIAKWFRKMKAGLLSAASIGFRSNEVEKELIDPDGDPYNWNNIRYRITDWELLEWSWVTVPSNPGALVTSRQMQSDNPVMVALQSIEQRLDQLSGQTSWQDTPAEDAAHDEVADVATDDAELSEREAAPEGESFDVQAAERSESEADEVPADAAQAPPPSRRNGADDAAEKPQRVIQVSGSDLRRLADAAREAQARRHAAARAAKAHELAKRKLGRA